ncbi:hypothetical protein GCM10011529_28340 [Polymorphobacter glacialis]|uniref:DUF4178 domain-containing protein n=1 Tax=Sandarakinorhabdus glacialis TaxID=1614636 RepID=A0A917A1D4_9SPHN|nr:DUF4178 domain-containing protein [Polymorphobacter glacialis]GGE20057.1 hypothetical protein GCM10011529_28340 [Polymorphobacter glacialis]
MKDDPGAPRALTCPNCGAPIIVRAAGLTVSVICGNCGSTLDAADPVLTLIERSNAALARPLIPLGSRGSLDGIEWEVVGYLERSGDDVEWEEYLLFNPWSGYRFLIHVEGNWRLGQALDRLPRLDGGTALLDGDAYRGSDPYNARVDFVVGEFYWRVSVGETVAATDYSAGGTSLSREDNAQESSWTQLKDLPPGTVGKAFGLTPPLGAGKTANTAWRDFVHSLIIAAIGFAALLVVLVAAPASQLIAQDTLLLEPEGPAITRVIGPVEIQRRSSAVEVRATTEVENAWVDLGYALVERRTQQRFEASATAEYYSGSDADGNWSEGDKRPASLFASIPRGSYDLVVEARAKQWGGSFGGSQPSVAVTIGIVRDTGFGGLFLFAAIMLAIGPAWRAWRLYSSGAGPDRDTTW